MMAVRIEIISAGPLHKGSLPLATTISAKAVASTRFAGTPTK